MRFLVVLALLFSVSASADSGVTFVGVSRIAPPAGGGGSFSACTDGVDCYCDTVSDGSLLLCEDFENPDYYLNTANSIIAGTGSGVNHNRGEASTWYSIYGQPSWDGYFSSSDPTPTLGSACGSNVNEATGVCAGVLTYCSAAQGALNGAGLDCWGPDINDKSQVWFQRSGDFDEEVTDLTLTGGTGATADIGAGNAHLAIRVPRGGAYFDTDGGAGQKNFTNSTEIGFTMLSAHATNTIDSGIITSGAPWKFEEWRPADEQPFMGMIGPGGAGDNDFFPYQPFFWVTSNAACESYIHTATAHVGSIGCMNDDTKMGLSADGNVFPNWAVDEYEGSGVTKYDRATDWPWGEWACTRGHITGMGTSSMELKVWHNEMLVIHISGLDTTAMVSNYYNSFWWNAYSNLANDTGLAEVAYRYRDNIHIRQGVPVSCAAVGMP